MAEEIVSRIWRLHGALALGGYDEGILKLSEGKISFTIEDGEQFNIDLTEVKEVKWPFYELGLCFTAIINERKYRFIFSNPFPARPLFFTIDKINSFLSNLNDISEGRDAAKKWKTVFKNN